MSRYRNPPPWYGEEAAGWPILGQFIAHDITADRSPVTHHADAETIRNFRTPRVNLECVYGGGRGSRLHGSN